MQIRQSSATMLYETRDDARELIGSPAGVLPDDPTTTEADESEGTWVLYLALAEAEVDTAALEAAETARTNSINEANVLFATARETFFARSGGHYLKAVADAGTTTLADLDEATQDVGAAQVVFNTAESAKDSAQTALTAAEAALPRGLGDAVGAYNAAQTALQEAGAQRLSADEILMANDADLKGTIGNVNIQNMTTLLTTNAVADITDDLSITIESASGIVGATSVGSLDESKAGMIIGGDDSSLDEDELLVYIV